MADANLPVCHSGSDDSLNFPLASGLSPDGPPFLLSEKHLQRHLAVLGGTGSGKSKFLELLMRNLLLGYRGFCLIDPHGDLSEDILAFVARRGIDSDPDAILTRIHYLEPSYDVLFGYDPFKFSPSRPIPAHLRDNAYRAWLHAKVDRVSEIIQRKQGQTDFEGMPRLQRVLRDVLYAVGTEVDGNRLALSDAIVVLEPGHGRHAEVFERVAAHLPSDVRADLERILGYRRAEDRIKETESTLNRLRSLFSPILKAIFSATENTIDFREIIRNRGILLVNLRETDYFSADQANALGGLFIHQILSSVATVDRDMRVPYYLIIDEAANFIGDDLQRALGATRKFKLSVTLAAQDLSSFKKKDFDMTQKVLSQCRSQVCFQQSYPEDLEILARVLGYGNLDFTEHEQVMDRPDREEWVQVEDESHGTSHQTSRGTSHSTNASESESRQVSETNSTQTSWQRTKSRQEGNSESAGQNAGWNESAGGGTGVSHSGLRDGPGFVETQSRNENRSSGASGSESHSSSHQQSRGTSKSIGGGTGRTEGESHGSTKSTGATDGESENESEGESHTVSKKWVHLARYREEWHRTGKLSRSVQDQLAYMMQQIHGLPTACAVVKLVDEPKAVPIRVAHVEEPFASPRAKSHAVEVFKKKLYETHAYFFSPSFGLDEEARRIDALLAASPKQNANVKAKRDAQDFG